MERTEYDWQFYTEKHSKYCRGFENGCLWPRGLMLGGSHGINAMIYFRGNRDDYDNWQRLGNPTWDFDSMLKYFKKTELNLNETLISDHNKKWHNDDGALPVGTYGDLNEHHHIYMKAAKELGYKQLDDINAGDTIGFGYAQGTVKNGQRYTTAKSLLVPAKDRPNLNVIKHAYVTKIVIDASTKTATGVEFTYKNTDKMTAKAKKEVIVSAGTIMSPKLLMLSGIGPKKHLDKLDIPVIEDLAVGKNLQDHVVAPVIMRFHKSTAEPESITDVLDDVYNYAIHRKGTLAGVGSVNLIGLVNTINQTGNPDIEIQYFDFKRQSLNLEKSLTKMGYKESIIKSIVEANAAGEISIAFVELLRPDSIGKILLKSKMPTDAPRIIPNYFEKQSDVDAVVGGIKILTSFLETESFKQHEGELVRVPLKECDNHKYRSNKYWECYLSFMATTVYHPIGTCAMGPDTDKKAVVDSELRVKNIKSLRVIDASIMPKMVSANINPATIAIAEKGSDFIKSTWRINLEKTEL